MQGIRSEEQIKTEQEAFNPFQAPVFQPQSQPPANQDSGINFSDCSVSSPGSSMAKSDNETGLNTSQDFFTSSPPKIQQPGPSSKVEYPNSPTQFQVRHGLVLVLIQKRFSEINLNFSKSKNPNRVKTTVCTTQTTQNITSFQL